MLKYGVPFEKINPNESNPLVLFHSFLKLGLMNIQVRQSSDYIDLKDSWKEGRGTGEEGRNFTR